MSRFAHEYPENYETMFEVYANAADDRRKARRIGDANPNPIPRCNVCGSIELREVERTARSVETYGGESVSWWCADCGADQGQG